MALLALVCLLRPIYAHAAPDPLEASNVVWTTPSTNSSGSMPLGNGDLGVNVWVEQDGDLLFYISKTDAWDEQARLVKLGRIRVRLTPNPFAKGLPFRQELRLRQGEVQIDAGPTNAPTQIAVWVDANDPVIRLEARGERPFRMSAILELWRTRDRALVGGEESGLDTAGPDLVPVSHHDSILGGQKDRLVWFHRNKESIWASTLRHQGLQGLSEAKDPLLDRTFGCLMRGEGLVARAPTELLAEVPRRQFGLNVYAHTSQAPSFGEWMFELDTAVARAGELSPLDARDAHRAWWNAFWNRSWLRVTASSNRKRAPDGRSEDELVSQGYAWQRFISACAGRGGFPIKFNGTIFTVEPPGSSFDPDYRQWGGCYWFQNTRLVYWPMLASGDFEMMQPLFKMYWDMLPLAKARTQTYFHHGGAFFPETMHFWGAYHNGDLGYGWKREGEPFGRPVNQYIRFYYCGALELAAMMLEHYAFSQDGTFLTNTALPLAEAVLQFYAEHYPHEPGGRLLLAPAQALETWWRCENPAPDVAGLHAVVEKLLSLPPGLAGEQRLAQWSRLRAQLPPLPRRDVNGRTVLLPGENFSNRQNMENPELYSIFPFRLFGVGRPELDMARETFAQRQFKGNRGWQQDDTQMAMLGLAAEARAFVADRFATSHGGSRFPAFWGPNFDWVPDQDHGANGLMTLQAMLLQHDGKRLLLFPAWPKDWDVDFKLCAPYQTTVEGVYRAGKLERLKVTPAERERDVVRLEPQ